MSCHKDSIVSALTWHLVTSKCCLLLRRSNGFFPLYYEDISELLLCFWVHFTVHGLF